MSTSNTYLSLIGSTWICAHVHANYFGSDPVCTPEKFWIRSEKERSRTDPLLCARALVAAEGSRLSMRALIYRSKTILIVADDCQTALGVAKTGSLFSLADL